MSRSYGQSLPAPYTGIPGPSSADPAHLGQPTSDPSGSFDLVNLLMPQQYVSGPRDGLPVVNWQMPDSIKMRDARRKIFIRDEIHKDQEYMQAVVLPMQEVDDVNKYVWDVLEFLPGELKELPHESAPDLVASRYGQRTAYLERFGSGSKMEATQLRTPEGQEELREKHRQIASASARRMNLRGHAALINAATYAHQWHKEQNVAMGGSSQKYTFATQLDFQIAQRASLQKDPDGFQRQILMGLQTAAQYGVKLDTVIQTLPMKFYTQYASRGVVNALTPSNASSASVMRKLQVDVLPGNLMLFTHEPVAMGHGRPSRCLLSRWVTDGGWVPQLDSDPSNENYAAADRRIEKYDEDNDEEMTIPLETTIRYLRRFDWNDGGNLSALHTTLVNQLNAGQSSYGGGDLSAGRVYDADTASISPSEPGLGRVGGSSRARDVRSVSAKYIEDLFVYCEEDSSGRVLFRQVQLIGDIEIPLWAHQRSRAAAVSAVKRLTLSEQFRRDFEDGLAAAAEMDATIPNEAYLKALAAENATAISAGGVTATLSSGGSESKASESETPSGNAFGTFTLPPRDGKFPSRPAGYNNGLGIEYLAQLQGGNSKWDDQWLQRIANLRRCLVQIVAGFRAIMPESPYFHPGLQMPYNVSAPDNDELASRCVFYDHLLKPRGGCYFWPKGDSSASPGDSKSGFNRDAAVQDILDLIDFETNQEGKAVEESKKASNQEVARNLVRGILETLITKRKLAPTKARDLIVDQIKAVANGKTLVPLQPASVVLLELQKTAPKSLKPEAKYLGGDAAAGAQPVSVSGEKEWVSSPLTHPASMAPFTDARAKVAQLSDMASFKFLKPADAKSKASAATDRWSPLATPHQRAAVFTQARSLAELPIGTVGQRDHVGEAYRQQKTGASASLRRGRETSALAGGFAPVPSKRQARSTGSHTGLDVDDEEDTESPFWQPETKRPTRGAPSREPDGAYSQVLGANTFASRNIRRRFEFFEGEADVYVRLAGHLYITLPVNGNTLLHLNNANIRVPIAALHFTPNQRRRFDSILMAVAGTSTGATLFGHMIYEAGDDSRTMQHWTSFALYFQCVVWNERQVLLLRDVMMTGYDGGNGHDFFEDNSQFKANGKHLASIMTALVPPEQTTFPTHMSVTGRIEQSMAGADMFGTVTNNEKPQYVGARFMSLLYPDLSVQVDNPTSGPYFSELPNHNLLCSRDWYRSHGSNGKESENTGGCGPSFPGCKIYRAGAPTAMPLVSNIRGDKRIQLAR